MEVKKLVGSRRRQLVLKMLTPISGDGDVASRESEDTMSGDKGKPAITLTPVNDDEDMQPWRRTSQSASDKAASNENDDVHQ